MSDKKPSDANRKIEVNLKVIEKLIHRDKSNGDHTYKKVIKILESKGVSTALILAELQQLTGNVGGS